jgi:hypothetical protein
MIACSARLEGLTTIVTALIIGGPPLSIDTPDYHDADLMLRVYEMRREAKTRENRDKLNFGFWPKSHEDVKAVQQPGHELNEPWRQLSTYWEMVYGIARNGIVNPNFWVANNGEGMFFYAKVAPYLAQIRQENPLALQNLEWAATETEKGKQFFAYISEVVQTMTAAR